DGYLAGNRGRLRIDGGDVRVDRQVRYPNRAYIRAYCRDDDVFHWAHTVSATWKLDPEYQEPCTDPDRSGVCVEFKKEDTSYHLHNDYRLVAELVLRNTGADIVTLLPAKVQLQVEYATPGHSHSHGHSALPGEATRLD